MLLAKASIAIKSPSWPLIYRWRGPPTKRALENKELTAKITQIWEDATKTYGSPRIHQQLLVNGETLSHQRVAQLKKAGIASQIRPKWITTTDSGRRLTCLAATFRPTTWPGFGSAILPTCPAMRGGYT